jgi:hypothetical protein
MFIAVLLVLDKGISKLNEYYRRCTKAKSKDSERVYERVKKQYSFEMSLRLWINPLPKFLPKHPKGVLPL